MKQRFPTTVRPGYVGRVKISDDRHAKVKLWARQPAGVTLPPGPPLPKFKCQRFASHAEMNRWKAALLRKPARNTPRHG